MFWGTTVIYNPKTITDYPLEVVFQSFTALDNKVGMLFQMRWVHNVLYDENSRDRNGARL